MSIFLPYSPTDVLDYFISTFSLDLSTFTSYETLVTTILSNLYFYVYWGFIIYISLKIFNRIWERFF